MKLKSFTSFSTYPWLLVATIGVLVDPVQNPTLSFQPIQVHTLIIALFPARFLSSGLIRSAPPKS